jgi:2-oxo-4-hydroxy-4-carboxy-5-ureidoimidazoline decarboxylase
MTLNELNGCGQAQFVAALGQVFEHSPWVAERAFAARPFASVAALHAAMAAAMQAADAGEQLALIRAHPELAGRAMVRAELTAGSAREQAGAGLTQCSPAEFARLAALNARYSSRFGFPFILAVKGWTRAGIVAELARRVERDRATELKACLDEIALIARYRLDALITA